MSITQKPNVSVCMTVFNGESYLREQLKSVLAELGRDDELVICDDGSTDTSGAIINEFMSDLRINYIVNTEPLGVIKNFEKSILHSRGDYIFLCDQDDIWLKGKLSTCVAHLENNMLVVTDCTLVDHDLQTIAPSFFQLRHSGPGVIKNIWKNSYLGCCMAFRRDLLKYSMPIPNKAPMHDMWFGLQAEIYGNVCFIKENLSLYRRHHSTVSPTGSKSNFSLTQQIQIRLNLCWCLIRRVLRNVFFKSKSYR